MGNRIKNPFPPIMFKKYKRLLNKNLLERSTTMKTKNKTILMTIITTFILMLSIVCTPVNAYAKTYPEHNLTVESTQTKIVKNKLTITLGQKIKLNKVQYGTRVGKKNSKKYRYTYVKPNNVRWKSYNKKVATVNKYGIITAKKAGKTVIKATFKKKTYKITVIVTKNSKKSKNIDLQNGSSSATNNCTHKWSKVYKTIHHNAITHKEKIWHDSEVTRYQYSCNCGACFGSKAEINQHQFEAALNGDTNHTGVAEIPITSEGYYETITIVDKPAYDEKVLTGYKCTKCGQTKSK